MLKDMIKLDYTYKITEYNTYDLYDCDDEYLDIYISDLKLKNEILEEALTSMGMDIEDILEEGGYYEYTDV
jgi:hypothetical protein